MEAEALNGMKEMASEYECPRVIFFGMECAFSYPVLQALLTQDIEICAVVIPASQETWVEDRQAPAIHLKKPLRSARGAARMLTVMNSPTSPSIVRIAWQQHIPVWEVRKPGDVLTYQTLQAYQPDMICVACFSERIPSSLLTMPRSGCLNVHPALLPANRGPVPVFWTLYRGDEMTGVTIHYMTRKLDSGDILAQETIPVPEGIRYEQLEAQCATLGGNLLAHVIRDVYRGQVTAISQDETQSSYYPYPADEDYTVVAADWSARRLYNFVRGVAGQESPVTLRTEAQTIFATDAISYSISECENVIAGERNQPSKNEEWRGEGARRGYRERNIRCRDGWVRILSNEHVPE